MNELTMESQIAWQPYSPERDAKLRILVLEDMPSDVALIKLELRKLEMEYEVNAVTNQLAFKEALSGYHPHIILSDYNLPQYTGMEALKEAREMFPYVPFIICTGRVNEETAVSCMKAGADDYVLKDALGRLRTSAVSALENKRNLIAKLQADEELAKSEENFRALAVNSPDNIYRVDENGIIIYANRNTDDSSVEDMLGTSIVEHVFEHNRVRLQQAMAKVWKTGERSIVEIDGIPDDEDSKWYHCRIGPVLKDGVIESLIIIPTDISSLKRAQLEMNELNERLSDLTQHLETIRDEEKARISMEIHDQLGQELTGNKLGLYWIKQHFDQNGLEQADLTAVYDKLNYLVDLNTQTIQTVRRIAHQMRPVVLDNIGLIPALEWHVDNYNKNHETQVHLKIDAENVNFEEDLSSALYRITQETLTNIDRHANAENAYINFFTAKNQLVLEVRDDGIGIDLVKARKSKSLGLFGIRERIKKWDGDMEITGSPGNGTCITVTIELEKLKP